MVIHSSHELAMLVINQRKKLGFTQIQVAERAGLKQKTISAFENRPESVMLVTAFQILDALDLEINIGFRDFIPNNANGWEQEW